MNQTTPIMRAGLVPTRKVSDARYAHCQSHDTWITPSLYWGLRQTIHLHTSGIGSSTYARARGLDWTPCNIHMYRDA